MKTQIKDTKKSFILENLFVSIEVSKKDSKILSVKNADGLDIKGAQDAYFFEFLDSENCRVASVEEITVSGNVATAKGEFGSVEMSLNAFDDHFIFEILKADIFDKVRYFNFATVNFEYDTDDDNALRAVDVAMTVNTNPRYYPDGMNKSFSGQAMAHLGGYVGAKLGVAIVPKPILRDTLKVICEKIDAQKGIVSKIAGAWALDHKDNFGDYIILGSADPEVVYKNLNTYKELDIDQLDFHQGKDSFRQGDFKYMKGENMSEFREKVSDVLKENGMIAGLHTYAYYVTDGCHELLSDPETLKQLDREEEFTLAEDISPESPFIPSVESTEELSTVYGFFARNLPYCLIDNELIQYQNHPHGFTVVQRGVGGTKPAKHKKGATIYHLIGCFHLFCPKPGSQLFKDVARYTAQAYNEGGFDMIYLDALDGITRHCKADEAWFYCAQFVHEILRYCNHDPIIEYSTMYASLWAARARSGAWDHPTRAFKKFNLAHHKEHALFARRHYTATLGWYNHYPINEGQPGNHHTKYEHWDNIDYLGSLAVMYNYSMVYQNLKTDRYAALKRNLDLFKTYNTLRKSNYFKNSYLEKLRRSKHEFKLVNKKGGKWTFVEKNYSTSRLYDVEDKERNSVVFTNPFKAQTPFIRLEHCMSSFGNESMILLPLNANKPLSEQLIKHEYGGEINIGSVLAIKVRVKGNGKKGVIGIKTKFATNGNGFGYALYLIDTDFEGWRDFILYETDNGTRFGENDFEEGEHLWKVFRNPISTDRLVSIELHAHGDIEGVQMSTIKACRPIYNVIKNPVVRIGEQRVMFECELTSTDFIEWDGKTAKVIDRYGNEKPVWFDGTVTVPKGKYKAEVALAANLNGCPVNAYLTIGTTGKEIK